MQALCHIYTHAYTNSFPQYFAKFNQESWLYGLVMVQVKAKEGFVRADGLLKVIACKRLSWTEKMIWITFLDIQQLPGVFRGR